VTVVRQRMLTLTDDERAQLVEHRDHDSNPQVRERCAAIVKIANGQSAHAVAGQGLLKPRDPDTVYGWLDRYEKQGLEGLLSRLHGGQRRRFRGTQ
jgi:transposase